MTRSKKQISALILLFTVTYMVSYITRINYGAVISEIVRAEGLTKSACSLAVTGGFITYGAGQIISGFFGDRFQPKKLVFCGLLVTISMNLLLPFCCATPQLAAVWCVNGLAQAFMWPPMIRLMTQLFTDADYKRACVTVSFGSSFGTIAVYLLAPALIALSGWRTVFFVSAACGLVMAIFWARFCPALEANVPRPIAETVPREKRRVPLFTPLMLCVMAAIIVQGFLRDGITTWMPSYIAETYDLSSILAILTGVVLPLFSILSFQISAWLYRTKLRNPLLCAGVIFIAGFISSLLLIAVTGRSTVASIALSALLTGCMHGVNLILICMIPPFFKKYGNVSLVSGVLNACTYIGSALSTYGIALISEQIGWTVTLILWSVLALSGALLCLFSVPRWKKQFAFSPAMEAYENTHKNDG